MSRPLATAVLASVFAAVGMASQQPAAQYPVMEAIAQKVLQKYQGSSCEQLVAEKKQPPDPKQAQSMDKALQQLRQDPEMRKAFIDKVAATIVNKMFECGMIP
jgi:glutamyl-tRNA reductase